MRKKILNYLGQVRVYSLLDLFVFAAALTKDPISIAGIILLWLSFIFYLESRHKDDLRLGVNNSVWLALFIPALLVLPLGTVLLFAVFSFLYTKKKAGGVFGLASPIWRGFQNGAIALVFNAYLVLPAVVFTLIRNLIGDFRDAGYDHSKNAVTIPVALGIKTNQNWAFYGHILAVVATTVFWFRYTALPLYVLVPIVILELLSYPFTPRVSNPEFAQKLSG